MQYSTAHNCCVYNIDQVMPGMDALAGAVLVKPNLLAVPCTLHNMQIMRHLGFEAYSPILHDYDWPLRPPFKPFDHQRTTSAFMTLHPRSFILNDIGTGKTLSALWTIDYLMLKGFIKKCVILTPLSTMNRVWENEIFANFLSRRKVIVVYGDRKKRERLLAENADFYVINHDGLGVGGQRDKRGIVLGQVAQTIRSDPDFNAVVVDEGSVYKDSGTLRYKTLRHVVGDKPYLWWLTATPTPNEPINAWSQARLVRKDYQESQKNFRDRTMYRVSTFKWLPRKGCETTVSATLQPAIRFNRDECLDLPPMMVADRDVELSPTQKKAMEELKKSLRIYLKEGKPVTAVNEAALRLKLIQIACGCVYGEQHEIHAVDAAPRMQVLHEVLEECNEKVLIFAPLTSVVNMLYKDLSKNYSVEMVYGATTSAKRNEIFKNFQGSDKPRIIVADPRTMAHGLTLTAATTIVWYGPTDSPETFTQANGRINRPGQTKSTLVVRLAATNVERGIYRRLDGKTDQQNLVLEIIEGE